MDALRRRQRTTLTIRRQVYAEIRRIATEDRRDISVIVDLALEAYIKKIRKAKRAAAPLAVAVGV
jgi:hypothetical protein